MIALFIICGLGILAMISEILKFKQLLFPVVILGVAGALVANVLEWNNPVSISYFENMISFTKPSLVFSSVILVTVLLWFVLAREYFEKGLHLVDHYVLVLFSISGAMILTAFTNMATLFLGIEILSIPLYILAASQKHNAASNEAGFKYLIMGAFSSGFLLFGITLVYGATASFDLGTIKTVIDANAENLPGFFYVGVVMILVVMLFKISVAPFHFWAPDVYDGSPTLITALMSTVVKTAAFAALIVLFLVTFQSVSEVWTPILASVIAISLVISNITAARQSSVKRMLAYSSISQASFMLMVILANNNLNMSFDALLYYSLAYSLGSLVAFGILYHVAKNSDNEFESFKGLLKRSPAAAICMTIAMLSLAGIPITAGFFAKYFVFVTLLDTTNVWLMVIAILSAAVGATYYLKVIITMFTDSDKTSEVSIGKSHMAIFILCTLLMVALGAVPGVVTELFGF